MAYKPTKTHIALFVLVILALIVWWQWDTIAGWFTSSDPVNERQKGRECRSECPDGVLVAYDCERDSDPCVNHQKK